MKQTISQRGVFAYGRLNCSTAAAAAAVQRNFALLRILLGGAVGSRAQLCCRARCTI